MSITRHHIGASHIKNISKHILHFWKKRLPGTSIVEAKGDVNTNGNNTHERENDKLLYRLYDQLWDTHTQIITTSFPHAKRMENIMPRL